jgi:hypothetical protein
MKKFERDSRAILKRMDIRLEQKNERGQVVTIPVHTGSILAAFGKISDIMEAAIAAATGLSSLDGKKGEPSEASQAIDAYLDAGGSLEELQAGIYQAYLEKNDPSSIEIWQENIARARRMEEIEREIGKTALAEAEEKLKKISGSKSTESASSS